MDGTLANPPDETPAGAIEAPDVAGHLPIGDPALAPVRQRPRLWRQLLVSSRRANIFAWFEAGAVIASYNFV